MSCTWVNHRPRKEEKIFNLQILLRGQYQSPLSLGTERKRISKHGQKHIESVIVHVLIIREWIFHIALELTSFSSVTYVMTHTIVCRRRSARLWLVVSIHHTLHIQISKVKHSLTSALQVAHSLASYPVVGTADTLFTWL